MDAAWALASFEKSPYKLNLLQSLAVKMGDLDSDLPNALCHGAPTGVRAAVRASGVWPRCDAADEDEFLDASPELRLCEHNHISAVRDE